MALPVDFHQMSNVATSRDVMEACFMQREPLLGGWLHDNTYGTIVPSSSSYRCRGYWLNSQGLLQGALARPLLRGDMRRS
jgi:hypothetical protein